MGDDDDDDDEPIPLTDFDVRIAILMVWYAVTNNAAIVTVNQYEYLCQSIGANPQLRQRKMNNANCNGCNAIMQLPHQEFRRH